MRKASLFAAIAALVFLAGCPDKDKHASIEANNKGVEAANRGSNATAIGHFKEAVRLYPQNHQAWYGKGQVEFKQKNYEEAAKSFEESVRNKGDDAMYRMWTGMAHYRAGNLESAQTHLEEAVKLNPNLYRAFWYLGQVHRDEDRPKEAAEAWTKAATLNPYYGPPFVRLGELYLLWDKTDEAISVLEQGTLHVKEAVDLTNVHYYLGLAYEAQQKMDKAIEAYSKAIDLRKENLDARFQRGLLYAQKGDKGKAKTDLEAYIKAAGGDPMAQFNKTEANKVLLQMMAN